MTIASLVLGICVLLAFGLRALPAVALGVALIVVVNRSRGQFAGRGVAIASVCVAALVTLLLLALLFPANLPVEHGRGKARAASTLQQFCLATSIYYNEYGRLPQPRSSGDLVLIFGGLRNPRTGEDVCGKRPDLLAQNPRRIAFMDFKAKDLKPSRPSSNPASDELAFYNPWGTPYGYAFDNGIGGVYYLGPGTNNPTPWPDTKAGDGVISLPFASADGGTNVIHAGCAFFSNGPDGRTGTPETAKDDIHSWK